jgi:transcription factor A
MMPKKKKTKKKKNKKKGDPNAPQPSLSGYMLYLNDNRQRLRNEYPGETMTQVMKRCGMEWRELTKSQRAPYQQEAEAMRKKYLVKLEKYKKTASWSAHQILLKEYTRKKLYASFKKDPNKPKKALTGYMLYLKNVRPSLVEEGMRQAEVVPKMASMWLNLSVKEKDKWNKKNEKLQMVYEKDMNQYKRTAEFRAFEKEKKAYETKQKAKLSVIRGIVKNKNTRKRKKLKREKEAMMPKKKKTKKKKNKKKGDPNAPQPSLSEYMLYLNDNRQRLRNEYPGETMTQVMKRCGMEWRELTKSQRAPYQQEAEAMRKKYLVKLEKYKKTASWSAHQILLKEYTRKKLYASFKKDPNKPKKALTGYMLYLKNVRPSLVEEGMRQAEVVPKMASMWLNLSVKEKDKWNKKNEKLQMVYEKDMNQYKRTAEFRAFEKEKKAYETKQKAKLSVIRGIVKNKNTRKRKKLKREKEAMMPKKKKTKKKKNKKKGDPNAPQPSLSEYMLYLNDNRQRLRNEYPGETMTQVMKRCGMEWRELTKSQRAPYQQEAEAMRKKYLVKLEKYKKTASWSAHQILLKEYTRKKLYASFKKDPNKPKKALTGYMLYLKNVRPSLVEEGMRQAEVVPKMASMWLNLSVKEKDKWNKKNEKLQMVYEKDMNQYKRTAEFRAFEKEKKAYETKQKAKLSVIRGIVKNKNTRKRKKLKREKEAMMPKKKKTKKKKNKKKGDPNAPQPSLSEYMLYLNDNRQRLRNEYPGETMTQVMKRCGMEWRELTKSQRAPYQQEAEAMRKKYLVKLEKYKKTASWSAHQILLKEYTRKKLYASFKKDPNKPKKALTGYMLYLKNVRPSLVEEGMRQAEVVPKMASMWLNLSVKEKDKWNKKNEKLQMVYEKDMNQYKRTAEFRAFEKEKKAYETKQKAKLSVIRGIVKNKNTRKRKKVET